MQGKERNSAKYFKDNLYFADADQIFLYKKNNKWTSFNDRCFVKPIKNNDNFKTDKTEKLFGILKISNSSLEALGLSVGALLVILLSENGICADGELLYCMKSYDIVLKHEHKENKTEYNPSWASSRRRIN